MGKTAARCRRGVNVTEPRDEGAQGLAPFGASVASCGPGVASYFLKLLAPSPAAQPLWNVDTRCIVFSELLITVAKFQSMAILLGCEC